MSQFLMVLGHFVWTGFSLKLLFFTFFSSNLNFFVKNILSSSSFGLDKKVKMKWKCLEIYFCSLSSLFLSEKEKDRVVCFSLCISVSLNFNYFFSFYLFLFHFMCRFLTLFLFLSLSFAHKTNWTRTTEEDFIRKKERKLFFE